MSLKSRASLAALMEIDGVGAVKALAAAEAESLDGLETADFDRRRSRAAEGIAALERRGVRVISRFGQDYPARLLELSDPPPLLYCRGETSLLDSAAVAIIGTRRPGSRADEGVDRSIRRTGSRTVISGLARGIDCLAHAAALDRGLPTIAVPGSSLDRVNDQVRIELAGRIVSQGGLVISEQPLRSDALPYRLLARNRIVAALAVEVIVIETGISGGTMDTVRRAIELGRPIASWPGSPGTDLLVGSDAERLRSSGSRQLSRLAAGASPRVDVLGRGVEQKFR